MDAEVQDILIVKSSCLLQPLEGLHQLPRTLKAQSRLKKQLFLDILNTSDSGNLVEEDSAVTNIV